MYYRIRHKATGRFIKAGWRRKLHENTVTLPIQQITSGGIGQVFISLTAANKVLSKCNRYITDEFELIKEDI